MMANITPIYVKEGLKDESLVFTDFYSIPGKK